LFQRWLIWPIFAGLMGTIIGASIVGTVLVPEPPRTHYYDRADQPAKSTDSKTQQESLWAPVDSVGFYALWTAAFTGVLAFSTILLWSETSNASSAAERAAKAAESGAKIAELALLSVEVPYLYPYIRKHGIKREFTETKDWHVKGFEYGNEFITYYFKNFGRTPAEIIEVFSVVRFGMGIPAPIIAPTYPFNHLSGIVVADGDESDDFPCDLTEFMYRNVYRGGFNPQRDIVWFSGYARYLDVFGNEYVVGFCLAFSPMHDKFYSMGGAGHNYRRKTKSAGEIAAQPDQRLPS
jgi:hypothetical protein